jgi:hypothetical protein
MGRRTRKQLIGKIENVEWALRLRELAELEQQLHLEWRQLQRASAHQQDLCA